MALLEALALGNAIVASAVGGIPEVLEDQGSLVPPRDVPALTRACLAAAPAGGDGARDGVTSRSRQIADLAHTMCAETYGLYRSLAGRNGRVGG
jgi:glycosyltransferase involved in cell wall biosynthesis